MMTGLTRIVRVTVGVLLVVCVLLLMRALAVDVREMSPHAFRGYIIGFGAAGFAVYVLLYIMCTVSIFPPIGLISLPAGFIFGPWRGAGAIMTGAFVGATLTFLISKLLGGRAWGDGRIAAGIEEFRRRVSRRGFTAILFLRLVPMLPWEIVNYAAGLTGIRYRHYITATMLGIIPSVFIQVFFSDRLSRHETGAFREYVSTLIGDPVFVAAAAGFVLTLLVPAAVLIVRRRLGAPGAAPEL